MLLSQCNEPIADQVLGLDLARVFLEDSGDEILVAAAASTGLFHLLEDNEGAAKWGSWRGLSVGIERDAAYSGEANPRREKMVGGRGRGRGRGRKEGEGRGRGHFEILGFEGGVGRVRQGFIPNFGGLGGGKLLLFPLRGTSIITQWCQSRNKLILFH